jgi:hypothetical protein
LKCLKLFHKISRPFSLLREGELPNIFMNKNDSSPTTF